MSRIGGRDSSSSIDTTDRRHFRMSPRYRAAIYRSLPAGRRVVTMKGFRAAGHRWTKRSCGGHRPMSAPSALLAAPDGGNGEVHVLHQTKIQQSPRRKFAVHQIARALGLPVGEAMDAVASIGEFVRSPQHRLEEPVARRLVEHLGHEWPFAEPEAPGAPATQEPPAPQLRGLTPPAPRPKRNNHPLMTPEPRSRDRRYSDARPPRPKRRGSPKAQPFSTLTDPVAAAFADASHDASPAFADAAWAYHGFDEVERDHWVSMGLRTGQARTAKTLRDAGVDAADLKRDLNGTTVLWRLQHGEGVEAVLRLLHSANAEGHAS